MKIKQKIITFAFLIGLALSGGITYTQTVAADCAGAPTSIITCDDRKDSSVKQSGVWYILLLVLKIMTAGVGILAVAGIAYGSALYASSSDKPEQAKQGMTYIKNVVIGLIAYGLMFILLNYLIPGGIFDTSSTPSSSSSSAPSSGGTAKFN